VSDRLLFSVAGARGIVGKTIDADVVTRLTLAFCSILPDGPIVVGRDSRPSGESFQLSAMGAVTATGRDCIDLGVATTPTVELTTDRVGAAGGIIVTASHNPAQWNALKFLDGRGIFIPQEDGERLREVYDGHLFHFADGRSTGLLKRYDTSADEHLDAILALEVIDVDAIRARGFKVVIDCINGAGSQIGPRLLRLLGVDVVEMNCIPNGDFYRDPEPRPDNLGELADRVRAEGADLGLACDPDADRLALVDDTGTALSEEYTLALAVDHVLSRTPGAVVVNMSTSSVVDEVAAKHGVEVLRTPVGEAHVVAKLLDAGAVIGGEGNGGVIYPVLHAGRDAILGMALILQTLAERGTPLSRIVQGYPPFYITKEKVELEGEFSPERISGRIEGLKPVTMDTQDGVKAVFADGWFHLRVSNTEGVVRVIAEAGTESRSREYQARARAVLQQSWGKS
jgi:phosphomannomutase